jgi:hypothetical protein
MPCTHTHLQALSIIHADPLPSGVRNTKLTYFSFPEDYERRKYNENSIQQHHNYVVTLQDDDEVSVFV